jgi:hypothetical protein
MYLTNNKVTVKRNYRAQTDTNYQRNKLTIQRKLKFTNVMQIYNCLVFITLLIKK